MHIELNGKTLEIAPGLTLAELIQQQDLTGKRIAVEVNEELVTRGEYASYQLGQGDRVEVVQAIGGG